MPYTISGGAVIREANITRSWGLSPASGSVIAMGSTTGLCGSDFTVTLGGDTFHGVVSNDPVAQTFNDGQLTKLELVDNRVKLMWDDVYCTFNNLEVREDDPSTPGVDRQVRYWHIKPDDWDSQTKTWTTEPYAAKDIINFLLDAPTVSYSWSTSFHSAQDEAVGAIDANKGAKLGNVIQQVTDEQGLVFTLIGESQLTWTRKGDGTLPSITGSDHIDYELGESINSNDTNVRLVGDRNRYQDMPIDLEVDWVTGYESFWFEPFWLTEVASVFSLPATTIAERAVIAAKARTVTLREYVTAKDDTSYSDYGIWGEVSRMEIPVWTYLNDIVFKAYRVPRDYTVNGIDLSSLELVEGLLAAVEFDIDSGDFSLKSPREYFPDTKAFIILQGQQVDLLDARTQTLITKEQLDVARTKWQACNKFNLDTRNKTVIFHHPVFVPGTDGSALFVFPNRGVSGIASDHPLYNIAVPNAAVEISHAEAKAVMVMDAEIYSKRFGSGHRKGPKYFKGLNYNALMDSGSFTEEVKYADGKTADQKATTFAASLIAQQATYASGRFKRDGGSGTVLNGVIDRVTTSVSFTEGISEEVTLTKELGQSNFEGERELERKSQARELFPGQKSLKQAADDLMLIAKISKEIRRNGPSGYANINDVMQRVVGAVDCAPTTFNSTDSWHAGQPVFVDPATLEPAPDGKKFLGINIADMATGNGIAAATQGVVPVRMKGPITAGDNVGIDDGSGELPKRDGAKFIGKAEATFSGTDTVLIPVRLGGGSQRKTFVPFEIISVGKSEGGDNLIGVNFFSTIFKSLVGNDTLTISGLLTSPNPTTSDSGAFAVPAIGEKIWVE